MNSKCIVCNIETNKYKCPQCFERYCSLNCCKAHKELCLKKPKESLQAVDTSVPEDIGHVPYVQQVHEAFRHAVENLDEDRVPEDLLKRLGESDELKTALANPHLRAMMENLVNTDKPDIMMARAMKEPIFTEFGDICLKIVDSDNPNLEPFGS
ncbi:Zinc finger HIT domain-containing protein 3 [Bulinus truncatus]|nr:Zinc finger HIT domain-containing protein 3 [Bulinus truncatus]